MKESELQTIAEEQASPQKEAVFPENAVKEDYSFTKLLPFFNIEGEEAGEPQAKERLNFIWDFFKGESKDVAEVLWKINEIEHKIGAPEFGTRRYEKLYRYLILLDDKKTIDRELTAYENTVEKLK